MASQTLTLQPFYSDSSECTLTDDRWWRIDKMLWNVTNFVSVCRIHVNMECVLESVPLAWLECTSKAGLLHIIRYGNVLGQHWYCWRSGEVSSFLINGSGHSPNSIWEILFLYFLAVVMGVVTKVKVGVLKNVAIAKKAPRPLWMPENLLTFVTALVYWVYKESLVFSTFDQYGYRL